MKEKTIEPLPYTVNKNNSKYIIDLNVKKLKL